LGCRVGWLRIDAVALGCRAGQVLGIERVGSLGCRVGWLGRRIGCAECRIGCSGEALSGSSRQAPECLCQRLGVAARAAYTRFPRAVFAVS
jgi:hypothetical protein